MSVAEEVEQEFELFHQFVKEKLKAEPTAKISLEESLVHFREYQAKIDRLREEIRPAYEAALRGETEPMDFDDLRAKVTERLKSRGLL